MGDEMIVVDHITRNVITNGEKNKIICWKKLYSTVIGRCVLKILVCRFVSNIGGWYKEFWFVVTYDKIVY